MITCGQLRCILATSAACRAILGMGRHRKGERGRGRVGFRPRSSPPCFIPLPWWFFIPSLYHVGLPQERTILYLAVACFVSLPQQHILLLALDLRFSPTLPSSQNGHFFYIFIFFLAPFIFLRDTWEVVWRVIQPTADVGRRVFLFRCEGGQERVTLTISCGPTYASSPGGPDCPL